MKKEDFLKKLTKLSEELWVISETDAQFEPLSLDFSTEKELKNEDLLKLTEHQSDSLVEIINLDDFFEPHVTIYEGEEEDEDRINTTQKFLLLKEFIEKELKEVAVYRIGTITIDVYILGKAEFGNYAGLKTQLVET
jgi:hypothetical protein